MEMVMGFICLPAGDLPGKLVPITIVTGAHSNA
jgi:hypothetical protein